MPSDANGVFSLVPGYLATTGETIQASQHNPVLEDIASSMSARLMRSGVAPMTGPLKIVDGAVGSPGLTFNTDGTSGLYKTTNGIGVSVNGTKVAEFTSSGASRMIGELVPWTRLTAPSGWVLPYGQTLSRTTYADLWTIAQTEIAAGNTFYNNGNGTTTFGVGDLRGRVVAGKDDMGGTSAGRLGSGAAMGTAALSLGGVGGTETHTLTQAQLPVVTPTFTGSLGAASGTITFGVFATSLTQLNVTAGGSGVFGLVSPGIGVNVSSSFTPAGSVSSFGSGATHNNTQPTMICNYILYVGA